MASLKKMRVVFVLGPPGSGKGTQCAKIEKEFKFVHLSAGDLLRAERQREGSEFGELIEHHITNGTIVPVEITCKLLENAMYAAGGTKCPGFLIDGFPRNRDNLEGWERNMNDKSDVAFVLFIQCDIDICVQRCLSRGTTSGRSDDNAESMRKRVETYYNQTMPIIDQYAERCLVRTVDGGKGSADEVFEVVKKIFHEECKDTVETSTASVQA